MASPQRENGFTGVANEIIERLAMLKLNGTQFRILMVTFRYTYGFQRKEHELSESFLSKATGIHKQQIKRELKDLLCRGVLLAAREATFDKPRIIAFNKNYEEWTEKLISSEVAKTIPGIGNDTPTGSGLVPTTGSEIDTQEIKVIKENSKESIYIVFRHWNSKKIIIHRTLTDKISGHINARFEEKYSVKEIIQAIDNYETILRDNENYFWSYKWGLSDFLVRGLDNFKSESDPFTNYVKKTKPHNGPGGKHLNRPKSFDAIDQWDEMTRGVIK